MASDETKTITVSCTWKSTHQVEVPVDYQPSSKIDDEWADQVDPGGAYLADWEVTS